MAAGTASGDIESDLAVAAAAKLPGGDLFHGDFIVSSPQGENPRVAVRAAQPRRVGRMGEDRFKGWIAGGRNLHIQRQSWLVRDRWIHGRLWSHSPFFDGLYPVDSTHRMSGGFPHEVLPLLQPFQRDRG